MHLSVHEKKRIDEKATWRATGFELKRLTPRHLDILRVLMRGQTNKGIGRELGLSPETVKHHLKGIFAKLGVNKRDDAIVRARVLRLLD